MRIPQLLLVACPECHGNLSLKCNSFKDELVEDKFLDAKMANLVKKFGKETVENAVRALGWEWKTDEELTKLVFGRVVYEGELTCQKCGKQYLVKNRLARFVEKE